MTTTSAVSALFVVGAIFGVCWGIGIEFSWMKFAAILVGALMGALLGRHE